MNKGPRCAFSSLIDGMSSPKGSSRQRNRRCKTQLMYAAATSAKAWYSSEPPIQNKARSALLPQRPRSPLKVRDDLKHLCAAVCQPSGFQGGICELRKSAAGNPKTEDPSIYNNVLAASSFRDGYHSRQPVPTQRADYDLHKPTMASSQHASDQVVVSNWKSSDFGSMPLTFEHGCVLFVSGEQQGSEPSSSSSASANSTSKAHALVRLIKLRWQVFLKRHVHQPNYKDVDVLLQSCHTVVLPCRGPVPTLINLW